MENKINSRKIVLISVVAVVLVAVVIGVVNLINYLRPSATNIVMITNYDELSGTIPSEAKDDLTREIYYNLILHFMVPEERHAVAVTIRPESFENLNNGARFVVDIDDFKQTYQINLSWGTNAPETAALECVPRSSAKYPEATCYGMYTTSDSVELYLPHKDTLENGAEFLAEYDYVGADGKSRVKISVNNCGDETLKNAALLKTQEWLTGNYLKLDNFTFEVVSVYKNCKM